MFINFKYGPRLKKNLWLCVYLKYLYIYIPNISYFPITKETLYIGYKCNLTIGTERFINFFKTYICISIISRF